MSQFEAKFENLNAIPRRKCNNYAQKVMLEVLYTSNWLSERLRFLLEPENITMQQFNILRILRCSKEPLSLIQIRERLLDKMSDTSRIIDRLIIKGLVEKTSSRTDKRLLEITITEGGRRVLENIDEKDPEFDAIVSNITEEEAKAVCTILDKMRGVLV
ncbi:MarR family winged helix-turn-helix transcriptional regulator [Haoranjiania flava]|uniref:MarR family transcriptional regulator n=1 Tax=Haoranjiania flava TaxID=1856322 RepID=A0AAE3ILY8_9BACT|nr:MarR family transcriptional regulator [Haoranjiania flava]MCU7693395.1 MarR family transcriptional regulator [Haoranjiania flava]